AFDEGGAGRGQVVIESAKVSGSSARPRSSVMSAGFQSIVSGKYSRTRTGAPAAALPLPLSSPVGLLSAAFLSSLGSPPRPPSALAAAFSGKPAPGTAARGTGPPLKN